MTEIYRTGRSFLKGMFNAIEAFRSNRDLDGWRLDEVMDSAKNLEVRDATRLEASEDYPLETQITEELVVHVQALQTLFEPEEPLMVPIRPTSSHKLRYLLGDASAEGFAIATQYPNGRVEFKDGLWLEELSDGGTNLREAQNHVNYLLASIKEGKHDGCEIWAGTDNAVFSAVWHKGMSSARHLFNLVLELKVECLKHEVWLHVFHVSGDRMIACGIDGGSRGNEEAGIYIGFDMRTFLPLDKGAFEQAGPPLTEWCKGWMGKDFHGALEPVDWYRRGQTPGIHVWAPPPGAALVALNQLAKSRHKRPTQVCHVFVCPRLLWSEEWRGRFEKEMDIWIMLQPGVAWPHHLFKPLLVGVSFRMSQPRNAVGGPWLVRQAREKVVAIGRALSALSETCHLQVGNYLRQLWSDPWVLPEVQGSLVC